MMGFQSAQNAQLLNQNATRIKLIHLFKEVAMDYNAIPFLPVLAVVTFARFIGSVNYQIKLVKVSHPQNYTNITRKTAQRTISN